MSGLARLLRERMRMLREDATAVAKVVEEAFRGESELDDDRLDPHLRQVFYDLQDEKILQVRRQEYRKDGHVKRGYYWSIDGAPGEVDRWARQPVDRDAGVYDELSDSAWQRRPPQS